jgi:predicted ATP-dependent endonuclease of OLD family
LRVINRRSNLTSTDEYIQKALEDLSDRLADDLDVVRLGDCLPQIEYRDGFTPLQSERERGDLIESSDEFCYLLELGGLDYADLHAMERTKHSQMRGKAEDKIEDDIEQWEQKYVTPSIQYDRSNDIIEILFKDKKLYENINDVPKQSQLRDVNRTRLPVDLRSRGFQRFLGAFAEQRGRSTAGRATEGEVHLYDDPAVHLHPEGKRNWLDMIEDETDGAQFMYATHSPFLIREGYPNRIRIVRDMPEPQETSSGGGADDEVGGTQVTANIIEGNKTILEPVRHAIGLNYGDSPFVSKRTIIVEGPSDYFILKGILSYFENHYDGEVLSENEVTVHPADGVDSIPKVEKRFYREGLKYCILLDADDGLGDLGNSLINEEKVFFVDGNHEDNREEIEEARNGRNPKLSGKEIEDVLPTGLYVECVDAVYSSPEFNQVIKKYNLNNYNKIGNLPSGFKPPSVINEIESEFSNQGYNRLKVRKTKVSKKLKEKLEENNFDKKYEDDLDEMFAEILGPMNSVLYD